MRMVATKENTPEILAPVGGEQQLLAAVRCGTDAVYFGLQGFNARRNAENFGGEDLQERIDYCHERGVKVYITVNTLVFDRELEAVKETVDTAFTAGADALIVQDLAVAAYCREAWPQKRLFTSTQMAIHNTEGIRLMREFGFSRFVVARELSLSEMRRIYEETGLELEVFVHGAHCMSVSGNCYLSAMIGGRSGNRGLCAQPCRLECSLNGREYALSLKDLSYVEHIPRLAAAGAKSLKIEGRMKRAEYVAAAVTACRAARDGRKPDMETLRAVFSRSGFTDGYLTGHRDLSMYGTRTKEDVTAAAGVLKSLARLYEKEPQTVPVDMTLFLQEGEPVHLTVSDGEHTAVAVGPKPQQALTQPITEAFAREAMAKTGGTPYYLNEFSLTAGEGLTLLRGQLNELRRAGLEALRQQRIGRGV